MVVSIQGLFARLPYSAGDLKPVDTKLLEGAIKGLTINIGDSLSTQNEREYACHCVISPRDGFGYEGQVAAAKEIAQKGFNWDYLTHHMTVMGRSVWCFKGAHEEGVSKNFPIIQIDFDGTVLPKRRADMIKQIIIGLRMEDERLRHYCFDLLMIHYGVDAIGIPEHGMLAIKNPKSIRSIELIIPGTGRADPEEKNVV